MNDNYCLVIEGRPNDFMPIDINILLNTKNYSYNTLESIDYFTKNYYKDDIYKLINEANIIHDSYVNGDIKIINDNKYRFEIICKDNQYDFNKFLKNNVDNKIVMNKVNNIYNKYVKDKNISINEDIKNKDYDQLIEKFKNLPYLVMRNIYVYIGNNLVNNK